MTWNWWFGFEQMCISGFMLRSLEWKDVWGWSFWPGASFWLSMSVSDGGRAALCPASPASWPDLLVLGSAVPALLLLFSFIFSDLTAFDWFKPSTWHLSSTGDESRIKARRRRPAWAGRMERCIQESNVGLGEGWGGTLVCSFSSVFDHFINKFSTGVKNWLLTTSSALYHSK